MKMVYFYKFQTLFMVEKGKTVENMSYMLENDINRHFLKNT